MNCSPQNKLTNASAIDVSLSRVILTPRITRARRRHNPRALRTHRETTTLKQYQINTKNNSWYFKSKTMRQPSANLQYYTHEVQCSILSASRSGFIEVFTEKNRCSE
jgi:hypothetical protein